MSSTYVSIMRQYLALQIEQSRHYSSASEMRLTATAPRVDAQASDVDVRGVLDPNRSPWCSLGITKEPWSWVHATGDKPALAISTFEAIAVLLALNASFKVQITPTWTDYWGHGSALTEQDDDNPSACERTHRGDVSVHEEA